MKTGIIKQIRSLAHTFLSCQHRHTHLLIFPENLHLGNGLQKILNQQAKRIAVSGRGKKNHRIFCVCLVYLYVSKIFKIRKPTFYLEKSFITIRSIPSSFMTKACSRATRKAFSLLMQRSILPSSHLAPNRPDLARALVSLL